MDDTTEPMIAVLGHPIAGNPSQFAVECALRSMELDWRVVSFDVHPEDIPAALQGLDVLGIEAVLIDPSVSQAASTWYAQRLQQNDAGEQGSSEDGPDKDGPDKDGPDTDVRETNGSSKIEPIDCLYRDAQRQLLASFEQRLWLQRLVDQGGDQVEQPADAGSEESGAAEQKAERWILIGDLGGDHPLSAFGSIEFGDLPTNPQQIAAATCILIAADEDGPVELDAEDWPSNDGSTLIVDLTGGHPERATLQQLGYRVVDDLERRIGTLHGCLQRWTGREPSREVIHDAIEEYLGV